jgi:hypothetical protein
MVINILNGISEKIPDLIAAGANIILAFLQGISEQVPIVVDAGFKMIIDFINRLADSIRENTPLLLSAVNNLCTAFLDGILTFFGISGGTSEEGKGLASSILQGLIDGLSAGIGSVVDAVKTVGENIISGFKDLFSINSPSKVMEDLGGNIVDGLDEGISGGNIDAVKATEDIVEKIINVITNSLPEFKKHGGLIAEEIAKGLKDKTIFVLNAMDSLLKEVINKINSKLIEVKTKAFEIVDQLILGLTNPVKLAIIGDATNKIMTSILNKISDKKLDVINAGKSIDDYFITGMKDEIKLKEIFDTAGVIMTRILGGMTRQEYKNKAILAGKNIGDGVIQGINSRASDIINAGTQLAFRLIRAVENYLGIQSPSTEFARLGEFIDLGLIAGMDNYSGLVVKSAENLGRDSINGLNSVINQISDVISTEINSDPVIRPVLDLTNIQSGANAINNMIGSGKAYGLAVSKINQDKGSIVNDQNGSNSFEESRPFITNEFNLYGITIRSEADIDMIAEQLYRKQENAMRSRGIKPFYA